MKRYTDGKTERTRPNKLDVGLHTCSSGFGTSTDLNNELDKASGDSWTANFKKTLYGRTIKRYQFPEKLQIIKPLEGTILFVLFLMYFLLFSGHLDLYY